jgi:hypothetical protein
LLVDRRETVFLSTVNYQLSHYIQKLQQTNMQTTSNLLMIKPVRFDFNAETAVNNSFQQASSDQQVAEKATAEFDRFVAV